MRNIWKKTAAIALSVFMLAALVACDDNEPKDDPTSETPSVQPSASESATLGTDVGTEEEEFEGSEGLSYATNQAGTTCHLNGLGSCTDTKIIIPSVNEAGQTVIGIKAGAFASDACALITEIDIPSTVKKLEVGAFDKEQCTSLTKIRYFGSESLWNQMLQEADIAADAFDGIEVLFCKYVDLTVQYLYKDGTVQKPAQVTTYINNDSYTVEVPALEGYRVDVDEELVSGTISADMTVQIIYTKVLADGQCGDQLTWSLYEDNRLDIMGEGAMYDYLEGTAPWAPCAAMIEDVQFDDGVTTIGAYAFAGCTSIETLVLPANLQSVSAYAFKDFSEDQTVLFEGGVNILTMMDAVWNDNHSATISFLYGEYEQDGNLENGKEAIEWTLVEQDNGAYLLTMMYAIEMMPYHNQPVDVTWQTSSLHDWLINTFANEAFTEEELAAQITMQKDIGTTDTLFILSAVELEMLFKEEAERIRQATAAANHDSAVLEDGTPVILPKDENIYWWLRDSGSLGVLAQNVSPEGVTNTTGASVVMNNRGVSVSVWVKP